MVSFKSNMVSYTFDVESVSPNNLLTSIDWLSGIRKDASWDLFTFRWGIRRHDQDAQEWSRVWFCTLLRRIPRYSVSVARITDNPTSLVLRWKPCHCLRDGQRTDGSPVRRESRSRGISATTSRSVTFRASFPDSSPEQFTPNGGYLPPPTRRVNLSSDSSRLAVLPPPAAAQRGQCTSAGDPTLPVGRRSYGTSSTQQPRIRSSRSEVESWAFLPAVSSSSMATNWSPVPARPWPQRGCSPNVSQSAPNLSAEGKVHV
jgi:hypothetical protein